MGPAAVVAETTMKKYWVSLAMAAVMAGVHAAPAAAQDLSTRKVTGLWLIVGGSVGTIGAFNFGCPSGYTTHTFENYETLCVYVDRYGNSDVRTQGATSFARPWVAYAAAGTVGVGVVLLMLPDKVQKVSKDVAIEVRPKGWFVRKTFRFGR